MNHLIRVIAASALAGILCPMGCARAQHAQTKEVAPVQSPIQMETRFQVAGDVLEVSYSVKNSSSEPVLILDRLWNSKAKAFNPNWAFVEIRGSRALIKRVLETKPPKLIMERPPVPYGRELKPGEQLEGKFTVPLPLTAHGAYDFFVKQNAVPEEVELDELGFMLGWTTKPAEPLPPSMAKVERDGEVLQPFTYVVLEKAQRLLMSQTHKIRLAGKAMNVPPRQ